MHTVAPGPPSPAGARQPMASNCAPSPAVLGTPPRSFQAERAEETAGGVERPPPSAARRPRRRVRRNLPVAGVSDLTAWRRRVSASLAAVPRTVASNPQRASVGCPWPPACRPRDVAFGLGAGRQRLRRAFPRFRLGGPPLAPLTASRPPSRPLGPSRAMLPRTLSRSSSRSPRLPRRAHLSMLPRIMHHAQAPRSPLWPVGSSGSPGRMHPPKRHRGAAGHCPRPDALARLARG